MAGVQAHSPGGQPRWDQQCPLRDPRTRHLYIILYPVLHARLPGIERSGSVRLPRPGGTEVALSGFTDFFPTYQLLSGIILGDQIQDDLTSPVAGHEDKLRSLRPHAIKIEDFSECRGAGLHTLPSITF